MKEQRIGVATFLPLDSIQVKRRDERLAQIGKLVQDLFQYSPNIKKAVDYAVGNVLYFDTYEEAKQVCFVEHPNKYKGFNFFFASNKIYSCYQ